MNNKVTTVKKASELHKELWMWLSENPGSRKDDWPLWYRIETVERYIYGDTYCFACAMADILALKDLWNEETNPNYPCTLCPLDWGRQTRGFNKPCCTIDREGPYRSWLRITNKLISGECASAEDAECHREILKDLALQIANLPWNPETDYDVTVEQDTEVSHSDSK